FATPTALLEKGGLDFLKRRAGDRGPQELVLDLVQRLRVAIAVKLLAAAIPLQNSSIEIPDEDRLARKLNQSLLLPQPLLALPEALLDLLPLCGVHEGYDHTINFVVYGPVGS